MYIRSSLGPLTRAAALEYPELEKYAPVARFLPATSLIEGPPLRTR